MGTENANSGPHFSFSGGDIQSQGVSPNRPQLFARFLRSKIGEDKFQSVIKLFQNAEFPIEDIEGGPMQTKILEIIGEENADCLKIIKFLYGNNSSPGITTF